MTADLVLSNTKAYVNKELLDCSLAIDGRKILRIGHETKMPKAEKRYDLRNLLVLPGLIDTHVHLRDENKAYKEDFISGTSAAAAGGVTTVLDMPNNDPVTMSAEALRNRTKIADNRILVNVGFYSEFPWNMEEIEEIVSEGAIGFKLFMAEQIGGLNVDDDHDLIQALGIAARLDATVAVHAEDKKLLKEVEDDLKKKKRNDIDAFLQTHSEKVEEKAVKRLLNIANKTGVHLHFCHVSTKRALQAIADAKKAGPQITSEATPHHLLLSSDDLARIGTKALTIPPLRSKQQIAALWNGIKNGWIDTVGSDHAPHALKEKTSSSVWDVKVGIPGLETTLPLLLNEVKTGRLSISDVVYLMAERPAEIFHLNGKGVLKEGNDADLTVVDLQRKCRIDSSRFYSKGKYSPFDGWVTEGMPVKTFVNGQLIMDDGEIVSRAGTGQIVRNEQNLEVHH